MYIAETHPEDCHDHQCAFQHRKPLLNSLVVVYKLPFIISQWISTRSIRRFQTEIPILLVIWMSLLRHHQTLMDVTYLLFMATALSMSTTITAFNSYFHHKRNSYLIIPGTIMTYVFLYYFNLLPILSIIWGKNNSYRYSLAAVYCVCMVFSPSVYLYSMYQKKILTSKPYKTDILMPVDPE